MKKVIFCFSMLLCAYVGNAQLQLPVKSGLSLEYSIQPGNQVLPYTITFDSVSASFVGISYQGPSGNGGRYILTQQSIQNATAAFWGPPHFEPDYTLDGNSTLLLFSRRNWNELMTSKRVEFDGNVYVLKPSTGKNQFLLGGTPVDAVYLEAEKTQTRLWLLNNPSFPLILQIENNPHGADARLDRIN
jgi:hypothetical protein